MSDDEKILKQLKNWEIRKKSDEEPQDKPPELVDFSVPDVSPKSEKANDFTEQPVELDGELPFVEETDPSIIPTFSDVQTEEQETQSSTEETQKLIYEEPIPRQPLIYPVKRSWLARLWDYSPRLRKILFSLKVPPPIEARYQSLLGPVPGPAMIIGPPSAGKTTFVGAIERACIGRKKDLYRLEMVGATKEGSSEEAEDSGKLLQLLSKIKDQVMKGGKEIRTTSDVTQYQFFLDIKRKGKTNLDSPRLFRLNFSFFDSPGEMMFPHSDEHWKEWKEQRKELIRRAKKCTTLIFCFDIQQPMITSLEKRLLSILESLRAGRAKINASRVLILLNKVDILAHVCAMHMQDGPDGVTAEQVAKVISPLDRAKYLLGSASLQKILNYMPDMSELAVGLVSTMGFQKNGLPLFGPNNSPLTETTLDAESDDEILRAWRPYGIYESLIYLATGKISKSTMELITYDKLEEV